MEKPPLGLAPKYIADIKRIQAIKEAVERYMIAQYPIPLEWIEEYNDLIKYQNRRKRKDESE